MVLRIPNVSENALIGLRAYLDGSTGNFITAPKGMKMLLEDGCVDVGAVCIVKLKSAKATASGDYTIELSIPRYVYADHGMISMRGKGTKRRGAVPLAFLTSALAIIGWLPAT